MSDRIHLATRKGVFTIERHGASDWRIADVFMLGDRFVIVATDPRDGAVYAAADFGHFGPKMYRSEDAGKTFSEIGVPTYPPKPDDAPEVLNPMTNKPVPWRVELLWSIAPGGADEPGALWCGTAPGGLFRSEDRGDTWHLNEPLWNMPERAKWFGGGLDWAGIHSICVDPRDSKRVRLGVSCAGVWQTENGGETWVQAAHGMRAEYMPPEQAMEPDTQDPHLIVQCPAEPDKLWAQHHNGIFRTVDGSTSWTEVTDVEPSAFGFAVAVHPNDGDTAWFVPAVKDETRVPVDARLVVTRTRDGGATFDQLTQGLPREHCYDLVFRHALAIDATGDRLAFGSTTGSLWVSEDAGDSWTAAATHLPPVYCLAFAPSD